MTTEENLTKFKALLKKSIEIREKALYPDNPLFELALDMKGEEITQKEQALLKCLLTQFEKMFPEGE